MFCFVWSFLTGRSHQRELWTPGARRQEDSYIWPVQKESCWVDEETGNQARLVTCGLWAHYGYICLFLWEWSRSACVKVVQIGADSVERYDNINIWASKRREYGRGLISCSRDGNVRLSGFNVIANEGCIIQEVSGDHLKQASNAVILRSSDQMAY